MTRPGARLLEALRTRKPTERVHGSVTVEGQKATLFKKNPFNNSNEVATFDGNILTIQKNGPWFPHICRHFALPEQARWQQYLISTLTIDITAQRLSSNFPHYVIAGIENSGYDIANPHAYADLFAWLRWQGEKLDDQQATRLLQLFATEAMAKHARIKELAPALAEFAPYMHLRPDKFDQKLMQCITAHPIPPPKTSYKPAQEADLTAFPPEAADLIRRWCTEDERIRTIYDRAVSALLQRQDFREDDYATATGPDGTTTLSFQDIGLATLQADGILTISPEEYLKEFTPLYPVLNEYCESRSEATFPVLIDTGFLYVRDDDTDDWKWQWGLCHPYPLRIQMPSCRTLNKPSREIYAIKCEETHNHRTLTELIAYMAKEGYPLNPRIAGKFARLTARYIDKPNSNVTYLNPGYGLSLAATKEHMAKQDIELLRNAVTETAPWATTTRMARLLLETALVIGVDHEVTDQLKQRMRQSGPHEKQEDI